MGPTVEKSSSLQHGSTPRCLAESRLAVDNMHIIYLPVKCNLISKICYFQEACFWHLKLEITFFLKYIFNITVKYTIFPIVHIVGIYRSLASRGFKVKFMQIAVELVFCYTHKP